MTLGFPEDKAFLRAVAERRKGVLEENISAVLGQPVERALRRDEPRRRARTCPSDTEAAWILAEARRIFGEEGADPAEVGPPSDGRGRAVHAAAPSRRLSRT